MLQDIKVTEQRVYTIEYVGSSNPLFTPYGLIQALAMLYSQGFGTQAYEQLSAAFGISFDHADHILAKWANGEYGFVEVINNQTIKVTI